MESDLPLTPLSVALVVIAATFITLLPRRMAMMPILAAVCFFPIGQSVDVAGLHFYLFRLTLLFSLTRVLIRGELMSVRWCLLDTLVLSWITAFLGIGSLSHLGLQSFVMRGGITFDWLISYIVARSLLRARNDLLLQLRFLAIMIIPLAAEMIVEHATGRNVFAVLGTVNENSLLRDGEIRAQGTFRHAILAGTFGAVLLPLMSYLIWTRRGWIGVIGFICAALIVWTANSAGAYLAAVAGMAGLCIWGLRRSLSSRARRTVGDSTDASSRNEPTCVVDIRFRQFIHRRHWLASILHHRCGNPTLGRMVVIRYVSDSSLGRDAPSASRSQQH